MRTFLHHFWKIHFGTLKLQSKCIYNGTKLKLQNGFENSLMILEFIFEYRICFKMFPWKTTFRLLFFPQLLVFSRRAQYPRPRKALKGCDNYCTFWKTAKNVLSWKTCQNVQFSIQSQRYLKIQGCLRVMHAKYFSTVLLFKSQVYKD